MLRLNIQYDVLPRESEILHLKFWAAAFELLERAQRDLLEETEGKNHLALLGDAVTPLSAAPMKPTKTARSSYARTAP